jgi:hypothetical protein
MKIYYHILTFIFLFSLVNSTLGQDLKREKLKGKVKTYRETVYGVVNKFGDIQKGGKSDDFFKFFDINGKETEKTTFNMDGSVNDRYISKRDNKGNLEKVGYISEGKSFDTKNYEFNEKGQIILEITHYFGNPDTLKYKYKYDDKGGCIESIGYKNDGVIKFKEINNKGQRVERMDYYSDGNTQTKLKYNEKGDLIESINYKTDGSVSFSSTFSSKYDFNGNMIEQINSGSIGTDRTTNKYSYDTHGNWIRKIIYENDKPKYWTERKIEYYL